MASLTIRDLPDEVHKALRIQAAKNGRSMAAEVRLILADAITPSDERGLGSRLREIGRKLQLTDEEVALLSNRDRTPHRPIDLG